MHAALLREINEPLSNEEIHPSSLRYGQVLVRVIASGICGAQLQEIRGEKGTFFPRLMGHEGVGRIEQIGPGVTTVKENQKCVMHWRKGAGIESESPRYILDGKEITGGQLATFCTHAICSESRLTSVPDDASDDLCLLLGCSLSTALGVMENEANLRFGESVLIIGCGGLGLNLILAAKLRQASQIAVLETHVEKIRSSMQMGATSFHSPTDSYPLPGSFDVVIDTTGNAEAISIGLSSLEPSGRFIMVGQPKPGESVTIPNARSMFDGSGKTIIATQGGRFSPALDIPRYVDAWRSGRLNLDGLVTHRFPLSEINAALDCVRQGQAGRVMLDCTE